MKSPMKKSRSKSMGAKDPGRGSFAPKPKSPGGMRIEKPAAPMSLTPERRMSPAPGQGKVVSEGSPTDEMFSRNFTSKGTPRLSASSGSGSMGQRR